MDANFHSCAVRLRLRMRSTLTAAALLCVLTFAGVAQEPCSISTERIKALQSGIGSLRDPQANTELSTEILEMHSAQVAQAKISNGSGSPAPIPDTKIAEMVKRAPERVCAILNKQPWPAKSVVGIEGSAAWISLIRSYLPFQTQLSLVPVISAGVDKNEIDKNEDLAFLIDRLRLRSRLPQLFGTQATEDKGFLVLFPLQSEEKVDQWRAEYKLPPLKDYIRALQLTYRKQLIRSTEKVARVAVPGDKSASQSPADLLATGAEDGEVVKVQTSLVTIDATVYGDGKTRLDKKDFKVYENGQPQEVTVFGDPESPFDIVLLLDLSGSTEKQVGLIKKTTKRFVEMKREGDRVAIVSFAGEQHVVSPLESDKVKLLDSIGKMKDGGDSHIWDAEKFALNMLKRDSPADRRKAIVAMTDGADNALTYMPDFGSETLFADLVEEVRNSSVAIFPIYLDTQGPGSDSVSIYADARRTLQLLANESGGNYYTADEISDLNEVYGRVLQDMGRVYSLGYEPKDTRRDGMWRNIRVEVLGHPEIKLRARPGYYAK